jgi:hypothetical protein
MLLMPQHFGPAAISSGRRPSGGRPTRPSVDLTEVPGNPANALRQHYQELMQIQEPHELAARALEIVQPLANKGMSAQNFMKFKQTLAQASQQGLQKIQFYLTNYMMKAAGLGVQESVDHTALIDIIGNELMVEDYGVDLSPRQRQIMGAINDALNCDQDEQVIIGEDCIDEVELEASTPDDSDLYL